MNVVLRSRNGFPLSFRPTGFEHPLERLVENMFEDFVSNSGAGRDATALVPRIDVAENPQAFAIEVEMPGVAKEDVRISVEGTRVSLEAEVRREQQRQEGEALIHTERIVKKYSRSFNLPAEVDDQNAEARLENGILRVILPKKQALQARHIAVQ